MMVSPLLCRGVFLYLGAKDEMNSTYDCHCYKAKSLVCVSLFLGRRVPEKDVKLISFLFCFCSFGFSATKQGSSSSVFSWSNYVFPFLSQSLFPANANFDFAFFFFRFFGSGLKIANFHIVDSGNVSFCLYM